VLLLLSNAGGWFPHASMHRLMMAVHSGDRGGAFAVQPAHMLKSAHRPKRVAWCFTSIE
jgi:hypothetical protein